MARVWQNPGIALKDITRKATSLAMRAADVIKTHSSRIR